MFERFTDEARHVVALAQQLSRELHHGYIGTEHILVALVSQRESTAARVLASMEISEQQVRDWLDVHLKPGHQESPDVPVPFTPRVKKTLELSLREAMRLGHDQIGTEHILLALLRDGDGLAGQALLALGADLSTTREQVIARHPLHGAQKSQKIAADWSGPPGGSREPLRAEVESMRAGVESLRTEVGRLRALLRRHNIDPDEDPGSSSGPASGPHGS